MKPQIWLLLAIMTLLSGCAQGYYDQRVPYPGTTTITWTQNAETRGEYERRIWWEESSR